MAHYKVVQTRNGGPPVVLADKIRRYNGALNIQAEHVALSRAHLMGKALPGERVIEGPISETATAVILLLPGLDYTIVVEIVRE